MKTYYFILLAVIITFNGCRSKSDAESNSNKNKLLVYVAAGMRPAAEEIIEKFKANTSIVTESNYASSGTLARQIANGAACDIFISANKQWIDYLNERDLLVESSIKIIASNSLVIIAPLNSNFVAPVFNSSYDVGKVKLDKIAIGDPNYVPVGKYTKTLFDSLGWFTKLENKLIMCKDVSAVRHYVELGECDWGVVYYTEAIQSDKVRIVAEIPIQLLDPIYFYIATLKNGNLKNAEEYTSFILSEEGQAILKKLGFNHVN
jgi:molybdate transport system substrate-binding protein